MKQLFAVGIGPGSVEGMTQEARSALAACDVIVGYTEYVRLVAPSFPQAECVATPMMRELERCRMAFERADAGRSVAMVCSGDAGVYGMASPLLEMAAAFPEVDVEVVPGVTAAQSGAAVLGAPLGHDFAVVSLSDLLTPWETIERRLAAAAWADFCVCLYNPRSRKRPDHLACAVRVLLRHKDAETPCGWVRNVGRDGQEAGVLSLAELEGLEADMFTTVFVGNRETRAVDGRLVTPRGYARGEAPAADGAFDGRGGRNERAEG